MTMRIKATKNTTSLGSKVRTIHEIKSPKNAHTQVKRLFLEIIIAYWSGVALLSI